jgi:hypothetical protein
MNVTAQYWFIIAGLLSLTWAASVATLRTRSAASLLYACAAWIALIAASGLMLEPVWFSEIVTHPDGVTEIKFNPFLHYFFSWGLMIAAIFAVVGSIVYVRSGAVPGSIRLASTDTSKAAG